MQRLILQATKLHNRLCSLENTVAQQEAAPTLFPKLTLPPEFLNLPQEHSAYNKDLINKKIPPQLQLVGHDYFEQPEEVGCNSALYSRLVPFFLAKQIEQNLSTTPWLDYKAFSMNFMNHSNIFVKHADMPEGEPDNDTCSIQECIESWIRLALQDLDSATRSGAQIFRRSLILCIETNFYMLLSDHLSGHATTIAIEKDLTNPGEPMKLMVLEYRMHEYDYNVHDRLFQWMTDAVGDRFVTVNVTVCLKKHFHCYTEFMMCMSVAYRVCLFLSLVRRPELIMETNADFENSSIFIQDHTFRMINWLCYNPDILAKKVTPIVSDEMAQPIFQIHSPACFLYLVPSNVSGASTEDIYQSLKTTQVLKIYYNPKCNPIFTTNPITLSTQQRLHRQPTGTHSRPPARTLESTPGRTQPRSK